MNISTKWKAVKTDYRTTLESLEAFQKSRFWSTTLFFHKLVRILQRRAYGDPLNQLKHRILIGINIIESVDIHISQAESLHSQVIAESNRIRELFTKLIGNNSFTRLIFRAAFPHARNKYEQYSSLLLQITKNLREIRFKKINKTSSADSKDLRTLSPINWPRPKINTHSNDDEALIDVIIPVYRGLQETLECIYSVLNARVTRKFRLTVINDCSPEAELSTKLEQLSEHELFVLVKNATNLGFVGTVNKSMYSSDCDVVLLNSDTIVFDSWLDNLAKAASRSPDVASVTPLSNNATIFSYPLNCYENGTPDNISAAALAGLVAEVNKGQIAYVPTAVGFCMYIRRASLNDVGFFDEGLFGKGYGEENDWCMRAIKKGWVHLAALDTYVVHTGGVSFSNESDARKRRAMDILRRLHPEYEAMVHEHLLQDPMRKARRRIDLEQLKLNKKGKAVLLVSHRLGGGTEKHLKLLSEDLASAQVVIYTLRPSADGAGTVELSDYSGNFLPNLKFSITHESQELLSCLYTLEIDTIHIHHIIGFDRRILDIISATKTRYFVTLHDYFWICPQVNLIDYTGRYCNEPKIQSCNICIRKKTPPELQEGSVSEFRNKLGDFLALASGVYVPDIDVARRYSRYFSSINFEVRPHRDPAATMVRERQYSPNRKSLRVVSIGAISRHKGAELLRRCVEDSNRRALPLEFVLVGYSDLENEMRKFPNFSATGPYVDDELPTLLEKIDGDLCFLPSVWPETYSFTLSYATAFGMPPIVFDFGAMAERTRELDWGLILSTNTTPAQMNDLMLSTDFYIPPASKRLEELTRYLRHGGYGYF